MRTLVAEDRQASCSGLLSFIFIMEKAMHVGGVGLLPRSCAIIFSVSLHLKPMNLILVVGWETWCKFKQARIGHTTRGRNTKVTHPILSYIYKIHGKKKGLLSATTNHFLLANSQVAVLGFILKTFALNSQLSCWPFGPPYLKEFVLLIVMELEAIFEEGPETSLPPSLLISYYSTSASDCFSWGEIRDRATKVYKPHADNP